MREFELARRMNLSVQQVIEGLNYLQKVDVLNYLPQTDKPQITFIHERLDIKELVIDKPYIEQRKQVYRQKMEAVLHYAEARHCRSRMLLWYFAEPNAHKCGICDVCLDEKRRENAYDTNDRIGDEVIRWLSMETLTLDELVNTINAGTEKERVEVIRLLLDAGKIKSDGERFYL
jgi:ATP-dependent DNA helicase RecQ